jgi:hypothetical protein
MVYGGWCQLLTKAPLTKAGGWAPPSALQLGASLPLAASVSGAAQNVLIAKLSAVSTPGECTALHCTAIVPPPVHMVCSVQCSAHCALHCTLYSTAHCTVCSAAQCTPVQCCADV